MTGTTAAGWQLAVDFGTSATVAAVSGGAGAPPVLLQLEEYSSRMPSAVFAEKDGSLMVGQRAVNYAATAPGRFLPGVKRELGREFVVLGGVRVRVQEAVAEIFGRVLVEAFRQCAAEPAGEARPPQLVTLTYPARWGGERTGQLRRAFAAAAGSLPGRARAAGLPGPVAAAAGAVPEPVLVAEPVAAAHHYAAGHGLPGGSCLAVYDLGGGTFDTAVVARSAAGTLEVRAEGGLADLGGEDFDAALFAFLGAQRLAGSHPQRWQQITDPGDDRAAAGDRRRLLEYARMAKEELSTRDQVECRLLDDPLVEVLVHKVELNQLIQADLSRSLDALARTLARAGLDAAPPAGIYLVGGSSRIPLVAELMRDRFGLEPTPLNDPKAVVALGALTAAATSAGAGAEPVTQAAAQPSRATEPPARVSVSHAPAWAGPSAARPVNLAAELTGQTRFRGGASWGIFSPDLARFATATGPLWYNNMPSRLDVFDRSGARQATIADPGRPRTQMHAAAFSPDGTWIATATDKGLRVWDVTGRQLLDVIQCPPERPPTRLGFSPDGRMLVVIAGDECRVLDVVSGRQLLQVGLDPGDPRAQVALGPGWLAVAGTRTVSFWDVATGQMLVSRPAPPPEGKGRPLGGNALAVSLDGRFVAASNFGRQIRVWAAATGEQLCNWTKKYMPGVTGLAFRADGLLAIRFGWMVQILDPVADRQLVAFTPPRSARVLRKENEHVRGMAFNGDGTILATMASGRVYWRRLTGTP
jgi:hypothetical protein